MTPISMPEPRYLGDAVYAALDPSGMIRLTTDHHDLERASNAIYLEPSVFLALVEYGKRAFEYARSVRTASLSRPPTESA